MAARVSRLMQYLLAHGCVTSQELFTFMSTLRDENSSQLTDDNIAQSIENVNNKIKIFNMMIRSAYDVKLRQRFYALISTVDNEITRKASHHTEKEIEYFRLIWQEIQENEGECEVEALYNIGKELKLANYEDLILEWTKKYWLYIDGNRAYLGPRSNLELDVLAKMNQPSNSEDTQRASMAEQDSM